MNLYYLYCINELSQSPDRPEIQGINKKRVSVLAHRDIGAAVSPVSSSEFNQNKIKEKLQDMKWIEPKVRDHERVIEGIVSYSPSVVPMRFGTVYQSQKQVQKVLEANYLKFKKLLDKVKHANEWSVKVYMNNKFFFDFIKNQDKEIKQLTKRLKGLKSEGERYFLEKKIEDITKNKAQQGAQKYLTTIFNKLKKYARQGTTAQIFPKKLTQKDADMVLNAVYLVGGNNRAGFQKAVRDASGEFKSIGLTFETSGPWPAYHFVKL